MRKQILKGPPAIEQLKPTETKRDFAAKRAEGVGTSSAARENKQRKAFFVAEGVFNV